MPHFIVHCADRNSGKPYELVVDAATADAAKLIASESHLAGKVEPATELQYEDPVLRELRLTRASVEALQVKYPDQGTLRAIIRGSIMRAFFFWFVLWWLFSFLFGTAFYAIVIRR